MSIFKTLVTRVTANAPKMAKALITAAKAKSPVIFAGTAILGTGVIAYTTYKCTPKYTEAIIASKTKTTVDEFGSTVTEERPITRTQKAKIFVKTMYPAIVAIIITVTGIVASQKINTKRIATLSAAYSFATQKATEAAERKATDFIKDKFGDEKAKEYAEKCEKDHKDVEKASATAAERLDGVTIYNTQSGNELFMIKDTRMMFRGTLAYVEARMEALNSGCFDPEDDGDWYTFNDIQRAIVPDCDDVPILDKLGYSRDEITLHNIWLNFSITECPQMPNGEILHVLDINVAPAALPNC